MKKIMFLLITATALTSCSSSSDTNEAEPNLAFTVENGNRYASSHIDITNISTNYTGSYVWEITSEYGTQTFETEHITFIPTKVGDYNITLKTSDNEYQAVQTIVIERPNVLELKTITLSQIPQDYDNLYFVIKRVGFNTIATYISDLKHNVSASNSTATQWDVRPPGRIMAITDGADVSEVGNYQIDFYSGTNNIVTRVGTYNNVYDDSSDYIAGERLLTTVSNGCSGCDDFEVIADFGFRN